jgi:hypothetical protein
MNSIGDFLPAFDLRFICEARLKLIALAINFNRVLQMKRRLKAGKESQTLFIRAMA